jgi:hypothetical protein
VHCALHPHVPPDSYPGKRKGIKILAEAISMSATMRALAKTAGNESLVESGREEAESPDETIRDAVAVALGFGPDVVTIAPI